MGKLHRNGKQRQLAAPTGSLTFKLGDVILGTVPMNSQALGTFTTNRLSVPDSPDSITAVYSGDSNFNASVSTSLAQTVNPATVTFAGLLAASKTYDGATATSVDSSAVTLSGVLGGDVVALDASTATADFSDANAGTQKQVAVAGLALAGSDAGQYAVSSTATLSADIQPAILVVTANDTNRFFAQPNPPFTASYTGFVGGDSPAVLGGAPGFSTTAGISSPVAGSPYTITVTQGTLSAANYSFTFLPGRLTLTPGPGQLQRIFATTRQPDGTVALLCGGEAGQTYTLQCSSAPGSGNWTTIVTNTTDGNGWMTCLDPGANNTPARFYRTSLP